MGEVAMRPELCPPPPPPELADAWRELEPRIDAERPALRAAILWVLHGESEHEAARRTKVTRDALRYWLRRLGVHTKTWASKRLVTSHKRVALLAVEALERRLIEKGDKMSAMALNAIAGTSTDKIAKAESWGREEQSGPSYASALEKVAAALVYGRVSLKIEVAARPADEPIEDTRALPEPVTIEAVAEPGLDTAEVPDQAAS